MVSAVTMMRRRLIAVAAAYAIALQPVVASFAALAAASVGAPGLCTSSPPRDQPGRDSGHAAAYIPCAASCCDGGPSGVPPAGVGASTPRAASDYSQRALSQLEAKVSPRNRPRGPPVA
jgi:hypothetical protein